MFVFYVCLLTASAFTAVKILLQKYRKTLLQGVFFILENPPIEQIKFCLVRFLK